MVSQQLTLHLNLREQTTFANFVPGDNASLIMQLQAAIMHGSEERFFYLWGSRGCGLTHVLQACCHAVDETVVALYLDLADPDLTPAVLDDLEHVNILCIDNIDVIAGQAAWEEAFFHLYNRIRDTATCFIVAAHSAPRELPLTLPDLHSRLLWGLVYHVQSLNDADKITVLQSRSRERGFQLSEDVALFLLKRCSRDISSLLETLDQLDQASLSEHRILTIPFVKKTLSL